MSISPTSTKFEVLTTHEKDQMTVGGSISTVTWMRGDPVAAADRIREKLALVVYIRFKDNPRIVNNLSRSLHSLL